MKLLTLFLFTSLLLLSCHHTPTIKKRAFIIAKTDDDNWTTSARIYCDSVNMLTVNHAKYWIDGNDYDLYAKSYIQVFSND
jgi:hypothetical protein